MAAHLQLTTQLRLRGSKDRRLRRRGFNSLPQRLARRKTRAHSARVSQSRIHEISTGENYEISTLDCSSYDADERDDNLVQRRGLLQWRRLLPRRLLYHNDPIIRVN